MIRWILLSIFMAVLSACDRSGHNFGYLPVLQGREGGAEFDLRIGTNVAKTIRNNFEWNPSFEDVARRVAALTARLSGCEVRWVIGDPSVQILGLSCDGAPPAKKPNLKWRRVFSCDRYKYHHDPDELICRT